MLRAKAKCASAKQMARVRIMGRAWASPSQRARHLWVAHTLEMHRGRYQIKSYVFFGLALLLDYILTVTLSSRQIILRRGASPEAVRGVVVRVKG
jgi:hypothetical protein